MKIKNKVGYCSNKDLRIKSKTSKGHYVYIREVHKDGTCDVNTITSLEDKNGHFNLSRFKQVKKGNTYPLPQTDTNFSRWSGINKVPIKNVNINSILDIGKKKIKKRHNFFIGKYMK